MKKYTARDYQEESIEFMLGEGWPLGVVAINPGAGKSLVLRSVAMRSEQPIRIVITPAADVEQQIQEPCEITFSDGSVLTIGPERWVCPRDRDVVEVWRAYCADPGDRVFITTHASFRKHIGSLIPEDASDWHLLVDEIHHSGAGWTDLHDYIRCVRTRGGVAQGTTATPFRSDDRSMLFVDIPQFSVPYTSLVVGHGFPERIVQQLVELSSKPLGTTARPETPDFARIAAHIRKLGVPTVLRVPPGVVEGGSGRMAREARRALLSAGYKDSEIVDAVNDEKEFRRRLSEEQKLVDYSEGTVEVIICCGRMGEASDWPFCAHVLTLGVSTSLVELLQRLGRALRSKRGFLNHPSPNTSYLTMVVGDLTLLDESDHNRFVACLLEFACALEMNPISVSFARCWEGLVEGWRLPPAVRFSQVRTLGSVDQVRYRECRGMIRVMAAHGCETATEMIELIDRDSGWGQDEKAVMLKDILESESLRNRELRKAVLGSIKRIVRKVREDQRFGTSFPVARVYNDHLYDVLLELADEYRDQLSRPLSNVLGVGFEGILTPGNMRGVVTEMVKRRRKLLPFKTDAQIIDGIIKPFVKDNGHSLSLKRGEQSLSRYVGFEYTVRDLHHDLKVRGSSLAHIVLAYQFDLLSGSSLDDARIESLVRDNGRKVRLAMSRLGRGCSKVSVMDLYGYLSEPESLSEESMWVGDEPIAGLELTMLFGWRGRKPGGSLVEFF